MKYLFEVLIKSHYSAEQYAQAWVDASRIIQRASGARGTYLHRDLNNPDRLLAIAHWTSKTDRDAGHSTQDDRVKSIIESQSELVEIRLIGEFAEPDWAVEPRKDGGSP